MTAPGDWAAAVLQPGAGGQLCAGAGDLPPGTTIKLTPSENFILGVTSYGSRPSGSPEAGYGTIGSWAFAAPHAEWISLFDAEVRKASLSPYFTKAGDPCVGAGRGLLERPRADRAAGDGAAAGERAGAGDRAYSDGGGPTGSDEPADLDRRADEVGEERVGGEGLGLELGVELDADEPGWSETSTISGRRPSGDMPEKQSPCFSSFPRGT